MNSRYRRVVYHLLTANGQHTFWSEKRVVFLLIDKRAPYIVALSRLVVGLERHANRGDMLPRILTGFVNFRKIQELSLIRLSGFRICSPFSMKMADYTDHRGKPC